MKSRIILARLTGLLYLLLGLVNLLGLFVPEVRDEIQSLGAVIFRYSGFVVVGIGLLFLKKWAAYLWGFLILANVVFLYTVYGGENKNLSGWLSILPWAGPILIVAFFYYIWPALKPEAKPTAESAA